jgi:hypothetical protein
MTNALLRRTAGVTALVAGTWLLGGCLDLGNGSDPHCSEATIEDLETKLDGLSADIGDLLVAYDEADSDLERAVIQAQLDALELKRQATLDALDACDAGEPGLLTGGSD